MDLEVENVDDSKSWGFCAFPLSVIFLYAWNNYRRTGNLKKSFFKKSVMFKLLDGYLISGRVFFIFTIT